MAKTRAKDRIQLPDGSIMTLREAYEAGLLKLIKSDYYDPTRYFARTLGDDAVSWEIGKTLYLSWTGGELPFPRRTTRELSNGMREASAFHKGQRVYVAFPDGVDKGVIIERGLGGFNLKRRLHDPYVVHITAGGDAGSEFPISGDVIFADAMAASIKSDELRRETGVNETKRSGRATTKPGAHGTLYLYQIIYTDPSDPGVGHLSTRMWAYNLEHAEQKFYDGDEGWEIVSIARVPEGGGSMHRAIHHRPETRMRTRR